MGASRSGCSDCSPAVRARRSGGFDCALAVGSDCSPAGAKTFLAVGDEQERLLILLVDGENVQERLLGLHASWGQVVPGDGNKQERLLGLLAGW